MDDRSLDEVFLVANGAGHKFALRKKLVLWPDSVLFQSPSTLSAPQNALQLLQYEFSDSGILSFEAPPPAIFRHSRIKLPLEHLQESKKYI